MPGITLRYRELGSEPSLFWFSRFWTTSVAWLPSDKICALLVFLFSKPEQWKITGISGTVAGWQQAWVRRLCSFPLALHISLWRCDICFSHTWGPSALESWDGAVTLQKQLPKVCSANGNCPAQFHFVLGWTKMGCIQMGPKWLEIINCPITDFCISKCKTLGPNANRDHKPLVSPHSACSPDSVFILAPPTSCPLEPVLHLSGWLLTLDKLSYPISLALPPGGRVFLEKSHSSPVWPLYSLCPLAPARPVMQLHDPFALLWLLCSAQPFPILTDVVKPSMMHLKLPVRMHMPGLTT